MVWVDRDCWQPRGLGERFGQNARLPHDRRDRRIRKSVFPHHHIFRAVYRQIPAPDFTMVQNRTSPGLLLSSPIPMPAVLHLRVKNHEILLAFAPCLPYKRDFIILISLIVGYRNEKPLPWPKAKGSGYMLARSSISFSGISTRSLPHRVRSSRRSSSRGGCPLSGCL